MTGSLQTKTTKAGKDYYYAVLCSYDEDGNKKLTWKATGLTVKGNKKRAEQRLEEILAEYNQEQEQQQIVPECKMRFSDWLRNWLDSKSRGKERVDVITLQGYESHANAHIFPYFDTLNVSVSDVTPDILQRYFDEKAEHGRVDGSGGLAPKTLLHLKNMIRQALKEAVKAGFLTVNPCEDLTLPQVPRLDYTFYTVEQLNTLFDAVKNEVLCPLIQVTAVYGLRRSEVLGLKWDSVDFARNLLVIKHTVVRQVIVVEKDTTKTKSSYRSFPLTDDVRELFVSLKASETENRKLFGKEYHANDYIFKWDDGRPFAPDYVTSKFGDLLKKYDLPHIRFHDLRHSCASLLISLGFSLKDIQEWLGHADITTTANIYAHLDAKRKQGMANSLTSAVTFQKKCG
jgi:integrase